MLTAQESKLTKETAVNQLKTILNTAGIEAQYQTWTNFTHNLKNNHALVMEVKESRDLVTLMQTVDRLNQQLGDDRMHVRAAAGWNNESKGPTPFWSFSNKAWKEQQRDRYNESYSVTPAAGDGDIIVRFSKTFQQREYSQTGETVRVPAGMQIGDLAQRMSKSPQPLSLPTASMIWAVSAVGLAGTGGHGTGREQSSFSGCVKAVHAIDHEGNLRIIKPGEMEIYHYNTRTGKFDFHKKQTFKHFDTIRAAHMGLFGLVTHIDIQAESSFKLKEKRYAYQSFEQLMQDMPLSEHFAQPYSTFMWMPTQSKKPTFELRHWTRTNDMDEMRRPEYKPSDESRKQEIMIRLNKVIANWVIDENKKHLLPIIHKIGAAVAIGDKVHKRENPAIKVGDEHDISHRQAVSFPEDLIDISLMIPVKDERAAELLQRLVEKTQAILSSDTLKGQSPITYAMYARYLKGDNAGLSPSRAQAGERVLAVEWVTHPNAPGLDLFLKELFTYINEITDPALENGFNRPRFHPGKFNAVNATFRTHLGDAAVDEMEAALAEYYGDVETARHTPFYSPYFEKQFKRGVDYVLPTQLPEIQACIQQYRHNKIAGFGPSTDRDAAEKVALAYALNMDDHKAEADELLVASGMQAAANAQFTPEPPPERKHRCLKPGCSIQ